MSGIQCPTDFEFAQLSPFENVVAWKWKAPEDVTSIFYSVEYSAHTEEGRPLSKTSTENIVKLSNLTGDTEYIVRIKALCELGGDSRPCESLPLVRTMTTLAKGKHFL